jgi:hypothetical protein
MTSCSKGNFDIMDRLPIVAFPRLDVLFRAAEQLWEARIDLQQAFPSPVTWDYWYWLMWFGTRDYPELRERLYPVPCRNSADRNST